MSVIIKDNTIAVGGESVGNEEFIKQQLREQLKGLDKEEVDFLFHHLVNPDNNNVVWDYRKLLEFYNEIPEETGDLKASDLFY